MEFIKRKVEHLISKHETTCPFKLSNLLGIQVIHETLGKTLGYYSKQFRIKIIHINELASDRQQEYICAHELGHAIFHPDSNTPFLKKHTFFSTDRMEQEAHAFAIELLFYYQDYIMAREAIEEYGVPIKVLETV